MNNMTTPREQVLRPVPAPGFPVLSLEERDRRWNLTRAEMEHLLPSNKSRDGAEKRRKP